MANTNADFKKLGIKRLAPTWYIWLMMVLGDNYEDIPAAGVYTFSTHAHPH